MNPSSAVRILPPSADALRSRPPRPGATHHRHRGAGRGPAADVDTIVVIYAENRGFDNLYGNFPGARGLDEVIDRHGRTRPAYVPQNDRDGSVLATLPQTWGGVTAAGWTPVVTQAASGGLPNAPFSLRRRSRRPPGSSLRPPP